MAEKGNTGPLRAWHVIVAMLLITSIAAGFVDLEPTVDGFLAERTILYYRPEGAYIVELFSGLQMSIGGEAARIPGYGVAAACTGDGFTAAVVVMAEPYLAVYTGGSSAETAYIGGSFSGLSCSSESAIAASIRGDGTGVLVIYDHRAGSFKMFFLRGLEEELSRHYNPSQNYTRNHPSWGNAVPVAPGLIAIVGDEGVELIRLTAASGKLSILGVYSQSGRTIAYGSLDTKGLIVDLQGGRAVTLDFGHTVRVIAATAGSEGEITFILEHVGSGIDVGVLGEAGDSSYNLTSLRRLSLTKPYSLRGAWPGEGMVWFAASLVGDLGGYRSLAMGIEGFGTGIVGDGERHIARLLPSPSESEASVRTTSIMAEKLSPGVEFLKPTVLKSSTIEPIDLKSRSFRDTRGYSVENVITALASLAPWAALAIASLNNLPPGCPREDYVRGQPGRISHE
ncbi:hypothetical protein APE_0154 [Aeropyrum pernix K1]|uniref:Uncharacterized protein n=1 Tax=Aeropyrum pernix (strain ATCC 700893 / DSM 11879 / JCM 9820 / NBRC 100138 / K1) TaxID=272557 RepID=Q9YFU6_AERPE|nr:hypothetical protein [Aeropyrum pernix]BAA79065.1 hypothetical protein APE_0154 [Aeropyrum pernix K1]